MKKTGAVLLLLLPLAAWAGLGGGADSVDQDLRQLHGSHHAESTGQAYSVHVLELETGTTVREYLNSAGKVFAVSWSGPFPPNLQVLLGDSHSRYHTAALARPGRHAVSLDDSDLVVHANGHNGHFFGHAWLPALLPSGVSGNDLQ